MHPTLTPPLLVRDVLAFIAEDIARTGHPGTALPVAMKCFGYLRAKEVVDLLHRGVFPMRPTSLRNQDSFAIRHRNHGRQDGTESICKYRGYCSTQQSEK